MEKRKGASDEKNSRRKETEEKMTRAVVVACYHRLMFGFFCGLKLLMQVDTLNQGKLKELIKIIEKGVNDGTNQERIFT